MSEHDTDSTYSPFMENSVAALAFDAARGGATTEPDEMILPLSGWVDVSGADHSLLEALCASLPDGQRGIAFDLAVDDNLITAGSENVGVLLESLIASIGVSCFSGSTSNAGVPTRAELRSARRRRGRVDPLLGSKSSVGRRARVTSHTALRADSPGAPSTHAEAMARGDVWVKEARGDVWVKEETRELENHARNHSWTTISRSEVPAGRRVHRMIWVYKEKRDGSAKARLCVQGSSLEEGIDYDQVFSAALRYSSARGLFALAARTGCGVRSVDLVAAYLQGAFLQGEVVFTHLPPGQEKYDSNGRPMVARVEKPIYGIQQAGRRLQRMLFAWLRDQGFEALEESDPCVFTKTASDGETLTIGVYVDNLQIVHSAVLNAAGRGPNGCLYNAFMDSLQTDWEVTDEGPMEDLLGIEVRRNADGSITLHQERYIQKLVERFLPDGPSSRVQKNTLPYSSRFLEHMVDALAQEAPQYPELVREMQERVGCLMYACTSTRPDIAYAVHCLCRCLQKPTPALIAETDHVISYLSRHASVGLTYTSEASRLFGYSDASWETRRSTSGWVVLWQSAALSWGSRQQKSMALSTCEAEIIALSEATKDVVYLRKFVKGIAPSDGDAPTQLATDSKAARDVSYNPEHHDKMKHVERRHFFVRDMVEKLEIEVPFVRTEDNAADMMTKPMKTPAKFFAFRAIIMNEPDVLAATRDAAAKQAHGPESARRRVSHLESRGGV